VLSHYGLPIAARLPSAVPWSGCPKFIVEGIDQVNDSRSPLYRLTGTANVFIAKYSSGGGFAVLDLSRAETVWTITLGSEWLDGGDVIVGGNETSTDFPTTGTTHLSDPSHQWGHSRLREHILLNLTGTRCWCVYSTYLWGG